MTTTYPGRASTFLGVVTAGVYSAAHPSGINKDYVAAYAKAAGHRANFISLGGYDGMHLIYSALEKTRGNTDADAVVAAMKGMKWESPRGPISIDLSFPKISSGQIRVMRQNRRIIRCDACDLPSTLDGCGQLVQVAAAA